MMQPRQSSVQAHVCLVCSFTPNVGLASLGYIDPAQSHWARPPFPEGGVGAPDANAVYASDTYYGLKGTATQHGE